MNRQNYAFDRTNFILLAVGAAVVIIGFILMSGGSTSDTEFNPDIFSAMRIKVAPVVCFLGFVSIIYAVVRKPKDNEVDIDDNLTDNNKR
ncbi:MAG: DUF3098 domain-containing protein [Prevotella sp.]|nr:DUF3098 domain-containing protein [Prevotella sp.]